MNRWEEIDDLERRWLQAARRKAWHRRLILAAMFLAVFAMVALSRGSA